MDNELFIVHRPNDTGILAVTVTPLHPPLN
jgi:hypothetical protein